MQRTYRPNNFVLIATDHGPLIASRLDYHEIREGEAVGVGAQLLAFGNYDPEEVELTKRILKIRRLYHGDGVMAIDCGANVGVFSVEWSRYMVGWGSIVAVEAQPWLFYALCGNIAINNCFNVHPFHAAVAEFPGTLSIPKLDYCLSGSYGSLELQQLETTEDVGQPIDYSEKALIPITALSIDSINLPRLDLVKIDVEGMEMRVLLGARNAIKDYKPIMTIEILKTPTEEIREYLNDFGYKLYPRGPNALAIHKDDPCLAHFTSPEEEARI